MEFVKHKHPLILNEYYHGGEGDACHLCREPLRSPLAHSVYYCSNTSNSSRSADYDVDCVKLLVHKSCAELPLEITNYYMHPQHPISLVPILSLPFSYCSMCSVCHEDSSGICWYSCQSCSDIKVCFKCVSSPRVHHPSHNQHDALTLVQHSASFRCYACDITDRDSSSCKCNICPFWIHMSCALLPSRFQSQFHKHPLVLAYSLPEQYFKFPLQNCKICSKNMKPTQWLYYCASCRFFVHIQCAHSTPIIDPDRTLRTLREFNNLVHLPAPDESSLNLLRQFFIHQMISNQEADDALSLSFSSLSTITRATPDMKVIDHWSHVQHPLILRNKTANDTQQMTMKDSYEDVDTTIMVCDGCTNPIYSSDIYYECHPCEYFLHRCCAELPKQLQSDPLHHDTFSEEFYSNYLFICRGCTFLKSGIYIATENGKFQLDIGCASLPREIKHEAHAHPFTLDRFGKYCMCYACGEYVNGKELVYSCVKCFFFEIHSTCALKPHKVKHRWDPHPLTLITNPENVIEDHPHDYNCEHCSEDIDTNYWFYHCSLCDLSCHMACINKFDRYTNIKFRSSSIKIEHQLHEHGLTLVLNKRKRCCGSCRRKLYDAPILECTPCKFSICLSCVDPDQFDYYVACGKSQYELINV